MKRGLREKTNPIDDACNTTPAYIKANKDDNIIFLIDTDEYTMPEAAKWLDVISNRLDCGIAMIPKDMICGTTIITEEEYTVINNILKRMMSKGE